MGYNDRIPAVDDFQAAVIASRCKIGRLKPVPSPSRACDRGGEEDRSHKVQLSAKAGHGEFAPGKTMAFVSTTRLDCNQWPRGNREIRLCIRALLRFRCVCAPNTLVVLAAMITAGAAAAHIGRPAIAAEQQTPKFNGDFLPEPPAQKLPWKPPADSSLGPRVLQATDELFELGLADPRGCEYRKVCFGTGSVWTGDAGVEQYHAWVIPPTDAGKSDSKTPAIRFAIAWNGLVYPLVSVGERADLCADVEAACGARKAVRVGCAEGTMASVTNPQPIKVCLLLRLGEVPLAERVWKAVGFAHETSDKEAERKFDPFALFATEYLSVRFDRCVAAHMAGNDRMALIDAGALLAAKKPLDKFAAERKPTSEYAGTPSEFDFLDPVAELRDDELRRFAKIDNRCCSGVGRRNIQTGRSELRL